MLFVIMGLRALGKESSLSMPRILVNMCLRIALQVEDQVDRAEDRIDIGADNTGDAMV